MKILFTVPTSLSMNPLDLGKCGDLVICSHPHVSQSCWNSWQVNWGPLSDTNFSRIPFSSQNPFRRETTAFDDRDSYLPNK